MSHQELLDALAVIHRELADAENLDERDVATLRATMDEIQSALDEKNDEPKSLSERVSESARQFEESHPTLTETLGRIADTLQQMGI